jgi:hypothetical protein
MSNSRPLNMEVYSKIKAKFNDMTDKERKDLERNMSWFFLTDNIKKKTREKIQSRMKRIDIISLIFAFIGVVTNIMSSYLYIVLEKVEEPYTSKPSSF